MNLRTVPAPRSRARRPALLVLCAALVTSLVLAGCGGSDEKSSEPPASQPTDGGTELAALWPLTGLPASGPTPDHPVMVVKYDNTRASQPQIGLGGADLVVEELVEGGLTRLAVMYYTKLPKGDIGPVRSMRLTDIGIVKATHGVLVTSGGAPKTLREMKRFKIPYYELGSPGVGRASGRSAPYNVFANLPTLAKSFSDAPVVPASYLPWGQESDFVGALPAKKITVRFSGGTATEFAYQGKKYVNTNGYAARGDEFKADSVLVIRVKTGDAGYRDFAGNRVPETYFYGTGNAVLFHGGQAIRGTWTKPKRDSPLVLSTASGEMRVPAGKVRIELLPTTEPGSDLSFR